MNEIQHDVQQYGEAEIDLRELFMALWKRKVMIASISLAGAILAGLFSMFIISPVYDSKLNIVISMPETYNTRYGEYKLPITTNDQYIDLITSNDVLIKTIKEMGYSDITLENLRKKISIGKVSAKSADVVQNSFEVTVSAGDPKEAQKLAQTLYDNYIEFVDVMTKERAINYYINYFKVDKNSQEILLKSAREILKKNEEILANTPETINQKDAMSQVINTKDFVVLENIINPNYTKVENDIIVKKQEISTIEDTIRANLENLSQLDIEKKAVEKYYGAGKEAKLDSSLIGVVETSIYLPSPPIAPSRKTSPSNALNTAIGLVLSGMLACGIALIREYWFRKAA